MTIFYDQRSLFRAYDIRGDEQFFTDDFIRALGIAFAKLFCESHFGGQTIVMGFDVRLKSEAIAEILSQTLAGFGFTIKVLGLVTTPMMAFWSQELDGHGIMVTASHSDKHTLGVKWVMDNASASEADITALFENLADTSRDFTRNPENIAYLPAKEVATRYINAIAQVFTILYPNSESKLPFTIVIDCMNGATSNIAKALFSRFCQRVILINDIPDGKFPNGNPDPTEPNRLAELQQSVIVLEADLGLAFDGDGDRLMIVDNRGKVVAPDHLLYLLARSALSCQTSVDATDAKQILFDIKCSHHLPKLLTALGAEPIMTRTGSSILRQELDKRQDRALFAGELSGHFIFNDGLFIRFDDAIYASLRLLFWLNDQSLQARQSGQAPSQPLTDNWGDPKDQNRYQLTDITQMLPLMVSTADHYLPLPKPSINSCSIVSHLALFCRYLQALIASLYDNTSAVDPIRLCDCSDFPSISLSKQQARQLLPKGTVVSCIDGVRLDFARGFGVLRKSNTSHSLTVRFAGDSLADLLAVRARFVALCQLFDHDLAQKIARLLPEC